MHAACSLSGLAFDMLFGPAYKGITLAAATAIELARLGRNVPFAHNRKEAKAHGEGGLLVGAPLAGRVVIVDDVITDGASKRESVEIIRAAGAEPAAVLIALDRMERSGNDDNLSRHSAVEEFTRDQGLPVHSIATSRTCCSISTRAPTRRFPCTGARSPPTVNAMESERCLESAL